jgi:hypothetical protein
MIVKVVVGTEGGPTRARLRGQRLGWSCHDLVGYEMKETTSPIHMACVFVVQDNCGETNYAYHGTSAPIHPLESAAKRCTLLLLYYSPVHHSFFSPSHRNSLYLLYLSRIS